MKNFFVSKLEDSLRYNIKSADNSHIFLKQKPEIAENPAEIYIVLHNKKMPVKEYKRLIYSNEREGIYTVDLFYKNGKDFMVRLGGKGHFKGDMKSLKNYSHEKINNIVHLRELEKTVLKDQKEMPALVYYQPPTERIFESLRRYKMENVSLDYSHLTPLDQGYGFAKPGTSLDYKLANEIPEKNIVESPIIFNKASRSKKKLLPEPAEY